MMGRFSSLWPSDCWTFRYRKRNFAAGEVDGLSAQLREFPSDAAPQPPPNIIKARAIRASICFPVHPRKPTFASRSSTSASCQEPTHAVQHYVSKMAYHNDGGDQMAIND
jgi:hypothetical protein